MTSTPLAPKHRIESIDILRGLVMLIMAIDHTRDFLHLGHPNPTDLTSTNPILFFTRFITHFCAPTFVFLSGISAYLASTRRTKGEMSIFLLKRGIWLMVVEVVLITLAITIDPGYHFIILQVIWAIGGSMILLALLIWLKPTLIGIIGLVIFFTHNIPDIVNIGPIADTMAWKFLVSANTANSLFPISADRELFVLYALLPWASVMFIGFWFGSFYQKSYPTTQRRRILLMSGLFLLALFGLLRAFNIYGDPAPWATQKTATLSLISFLNVSKYPPSLLYSSLTLGVALIFLSQVENVTSQFSKVLKVYGSVPLFYYLCHWYILMPTTIVTFFAQGFKTSDAKEFDGMPPTFGFPLWGVYLTWIAVIVLLYLPCRWYGNYKKTHNHWWLSYI